MSVSLIDPSARLGPGVRRLERMRMRKPRLSPVRCSRLVLASSCSLGAIARARQTCSSTRLMLGPQLASRESATPTAPRTAPVAPTPLCSPLNWPLVARRSGPRALPVPWRARPSRTAFGAWVEAPVRWTSSAWPACAAPEDRAGGRGSICHNRSTMKLLRMKPGHGEIVLAEGDVRVPEQERELIEAFRRELDAGMWAAVPTGTPGGRREAELVKNFAEVPREAERVIFFPRAAGGAPRGTR